jgi:chromatin assembly factor 1 subunit B
VKRKHFVSRSGNGRMLVVSSTDGYCSIVTFAVGELGVIYEPRKDTPNKERTNEETAAFEPMEGSEKEVVTKGTTSAKLPEGTDRSESFLNTQEIHSSDTPGDSCVSDKTLSNNKCDETSAELVKPLIFEEIQVSSSPSEETSENIKFPDLQKIPEVIKTNFCGVSASISKQEKTPRRIKPVLLSSPRKALVRPSHSNDRSERKREPSSVMTPRRICPVISTTPDKSLDCKSKEVINLKHKSNDDVSERIHPSLSQCRQNEKETPGGPKMSNLSSNCIKPLLASEETSVNEISSDDLTMEVAAETTKLDDNVETMESSNKDNKVASSNESMKVETHPVVPEDDVTVLTCTKPADAATAAAVPSNYPESMEMESNDSLLTKNRHASKFEPMETSTIATSPVSPLATSVMPGQDKRTPRRVQLITLSSPKSKKKLL